MLLSPVIKLSSQFHWCGSAGGTGEASWLSSAQILHGRLSCCNESHMALLATVWELPCLSLLISSNTIFGSRYIPTPFEVSAVYSVTVELSCLLIVCWVILSTTCPYSFFFFFFSFLSFFIFFIFSEKCWERVCVTLSVYQHNGYDFPTELCMVSWCQERSIGIKESETKLVWEEPLKAI